MVFPDQLKVRVPSRDPAFDALDDFLWEVAAWEPGAERLIDDVYGAGSDRELAEAVQRLLDELVLGEPGMVYAALRLLADAHALRPGTLGASLGRAAPAGSGPGGIGARYRASGPAVGRDAERIRGERALTRRSTGVRILCITGAPGAGKTHLASDILAGYGQEASGPRLEVRLTTPGPAMGDRPAARAAYDALADLLAQLGTGGADLPATLEQRQARYAAELSGAEPVILIDDAVDVTQVLPLLPPGNGVVVVTSRESLTGLAGLGAEYLPLRPLEWHGSRQLARGRFPDPGAEPGAVAEPDAAAEADPPTKPDAAAITAIHEMCGGMPVPTVVVSRWLARSGAATGTPADRLETVRRAAGSARPDARPAGELPASGAVAAVLCLLSEDEQAVARALGLLRLPDADLLVACLATGLSRARVTEALEQLACLGLVERSGAGRGWAMPPLGADYVFDCYFAGRPDATIELEQALGAVVAVYRRRAENLRDLMAPARPQAPPRLPELAGAAWHVERESFAALLAAAANSVRPALARGLAAAFLDAVCLDGDWRETDRYLAPLLPVARDARDHRLEAAVLLRFGRDAIRQGERASATALLDAAARAAGAADDGPLREEAERARGEIPPLDGAGQPGGPAELAGPAEPAGPGEEAEAGQLLGLEPAAPAGPMLFGRSAHGR